MAHGSTISGNTQRPSLIEANIYKGKKRLASDGAPAFTPKPKYDDSIMPLTASPRLKLPAARQTHGTKHTPRSSLRQDMQK